MVLRTATIQHPKNIGGMIHFVSSAICLIMELLLVPLLLLLPGTTSSTSVPWKTKAKFNVELISPASNRQVSTPSLSREKRSQTMLVQL